MSKFVLFGSEQPPVVEEDWFGPHLFDNWCYVTTDPEEPMTHRDWDIEGFIAGGWTK